MDGYTEDREYDEPAPDEDYMIASTGIVKALGVCLGNKDLHKLTPRNASPAISGTATPTNRAQAVPGVKKPRDVSFELCESARKIRRRLQPAMIKEDQAGNVDTYRRLMYLDQTLERTIARFEAEYPESRPVTQPSSYSAEPTPSLTQSYASEPLSRITSVNSEEQFSGGFTGHTKPRPAMASIYGPNTDEDDGLVRTSSNASLSARAQSQEEGRMHRFGQQFRREILKPAGTDDLLHGTSVHDEPEANHLAAMRSRLEGYTGDELRQQVELKGREEVVREFGINVEQLRALEQDDPEAFMRLKEYSQHDGTPASQITTTTAMSHDLEVGRLVKNDKNLVGLLHYVGPIHVSPNPDQLWCGIEIAKAEGKNNGSVKEVEYFKCPPQHGLFLKRDAIIGHVEPKTVEERKLLVKGGKLRQQSGPGQAQEQESQDGGSGRATPASRNGTTATTATTADRNSREISKKRTIMLKESNSASSAVQKSPARPSAVSRQSIASPTARPT
ncbi:Microtubules assembly and stabilization protein, partial [Elasticomyces elasticus]